MPGVSGGPLLTDRRRRLDRFHSRRLDDMRLKTHQAIARLNLGPTAKLLHMLTTLADANGASWRGARRLAIDLELSETWVRMLYARACREGSLQQVQRGGGRYRTSVYLLKIGAWFETGTDAQHRFGERAKAARYAFYDWINGLFLARRDQKSFQYAPAKLKPKPPP